MSHVFAKSELQFNRANLARPDRKIKAEVVVSSSHVKVAVAITKIAVMLQRVEAIVRMIRAATRGQDKVRAISRRVSRLTIHLLRY